MELIKVTEQNGKQAVSARELYQFLSNDLESKHFNEWSVRNIIKNDFATENVDYQRIPFRGGSGREVIEYALSIDFAKELSLMSQCEKGKQARLYFIEIEKKYKESIVHQFEIPKTYSQALMLAARQAEQIEIQETKIKELTPKAEFFDAVTDSKKAVDMATCAKVLNLGIGRNTLFEFLRVKKILMDNNQPYQKYIDMGLFRVIEQKYTKPSGETNINIKTVVYQKGLDYIRRTYADFLKEEKES
jgi:anti-repressor protein